MKVSLVVKSPGKMENKAIPVPGSQFLIGRDPQCQLRPSNPLISHRHCALLIRGDKLFIRDLVSTNGTSVNDERIQGEVELNNNDRITLGPLHFAILIEQPALVLAPANAPALTPASQEEDLAASLLLGMSDEPGALARSEAPTESDIPAGTVEHAMPPADPTAPGAAGDATATSKLEQVKQAQADTSVAASAILTKYLRRR
jgi:predicted component of type VI protein secretion system